VDQPARYGVTYDLMLGNTGGDTVPDGLLSTIESDVNVAGLLLYAEGQARVGPTTLRLIGMQPVKGEVAPAILAGRLPVGRGEIALGRLAAATLHVKIGDQLSLTGDIGTESFHVTGLAVVPSIGLNEGIGQDGILTMEALTLLNPTVSPDAAAVKLRSDAPGGAAAQLARATGVPEEEIAAGQPTGTPPAAIVNVARVRSIPFVLAALLAALAVLTVVHAMVTSVQNRRRDVAVLRALGADRRWVGRAVHWQATAFTLLPIAVGVPLGLIIGRIVFRSFADSIGTLNEASIPLLLVAGAVGGLLVLANVVAAFPARRVDRVAPAVLLRPE
jgi:ABC-type lipoprotein release transport system permease subunit